ncbi:MAG: response regulator [Treponemataceae bacterium]
MKTVFIIDAPPLFRDFLKYKLSAEKVKVEIAESNRGAFTKCLSQIPDLIIINIEKSIYDISEFLDKKAGNPNTKNIPIIVAGPDLQKPTIDKIVSYGVVKYFFKPIRFDIFFEFLSKQLRLFFSLDITPCILEMHVNNDILFIEIGQGLNRDKLYFLKYKVSEILDQVKLSRPKVVIMMTDLTLSFVDGVNLEFLFSNVLADSRVNPSNVKVLSFDSFTKDFIAGHDEFAGISVATNIQNVLSSLIENTETSDMAEFINENILASTAEVQAGAVEMQYNPNLQTVSEETNVAGITIAVVDDDPAVHVFLKGVFKNIGNIISFNNGSDFLTAIGKNKFDITFLDIKMPGYSGLDVLKILQGKRYIDPVIVYTVSQEKNTIMNALNLGAKSVLIKNKSDPKKIIAKVNEILNYEI